MGAILHDFRVGHDLEDEMEGVDVKEHELVELECDFSLEYGRPKRRSTRPVCDVKNDATDFGRCHDLEQADDLAVVVDVDLHKGGCGA